VGEARRKLSEGYPSSRRAIASPGIEKFKAANWQVALDVEIQTENMASRLQALERAPSDRRGKQTEFIPIRFIPATKLTQNHRLLLAFDAFVLSKFLRREVRLGKIIHGDDYRSQKVMVSALLPLVRKLVAKLAELQVGGVMPDLTLIRHCGECEFQDRCREKALEKDDLSLLAGIAGKERKKYHAKGIFTVTQLSYTYHPRRRSKRLRERREKYQHSLKALAVREKKIYVVGSPELKIEGTPAFLDVESVPDRAHWLKGKSG
jgi:predicted RecB family nuclease